MVKKICKGFCKCPDCHQLAKLYGDSTPISKKGTLTLKKMKKLYDSIPKDDYVIESWKMPLLWFLYLFIGYTTEFEDWKSYWVDIKGVKYLLKSSKVKF